MNPKSNEALASYLSDMSALEEHIQKALEGQLKDSNIESSVAAVLGEIHARCEAHVSGLNALHEAIAEPGQGVSDLVKKAASGLLGFGAAAIDRARTEFAKNLRDDYTALSLANAGYAMLYTSALSMKSVAVETAARQFLADHTKSAAAVFDLLPSAVFSTLRDDGAEADLNVLSTAKAGIEQAIRA